MEWPTGQERRAWLDRKGQAALDAIQYYLGPGVNVGGIATIADAFNPVADIQRAGTAARGAVQPGLTASERAGYVGSALTDMASVLAPVAGAAYADDAARGLTEGLANLTMPADDAAARFFVDEDGAIRAWHGSPHDFDRFSMDKIGTGEGAQAYGHGLYFAENPDVAHGYKLRTSNQAGRFSFDGKPLETSEDFWAMEDALNASGNWRQAKAFARIASDVRQGYSIEDATRMARDWFRNDQGMLDAVDQLNTRLSHTRPDGRLYEVNIDANPEDFLDWDAPLSAQPESVRRLAETMPRRDIEFRFNGYNGSYVQKMPGGGSKKLGDVADIGRGQYRVKIGNEEIGVVRSPEDAKALLDREIERRGLMELFNPRGSDLYAELAGGIDSLVHDSPNRVGATEMFREAGIPGIRYLDAGSRGAGDGSRNFVVFDDRLVDILGKDGQRTTPQGKAQDVLDMLTSGRASEVTDDMLDLGDPVLNAQLNEYLYRNYDLPMDEASRMARAREMGFGDDLYHGTMKDFPAFSKEGDDVELNFGENQFNLGHFLTNDPRYAGQYAVPAYNGQQGGPNVMPVRTNANLAQRDAALIDEIETNWTGDQSAAFAKELTGDGFGGVDFGAVRYRGQTPTTEVAVFDPANIRSRFARFDPRLAHLRNLSAGLGGIASLPILEEQMRAYLESLPES